jgi:Clostripain family
MADKEWTIIIYMAGDNNLSEEMIRSINEIRNGSGCGKMQNKGTINVDFVVQYDGVHPNVDTRRYYDFFDTNLPCDTLTKQEEKLPIEEKISDFVKYSIEKKPAKNYALILSGHTDAFQGRTLLADENPPGVATIEKMRLCLKKEIVDKQVGNKPAGEKLKILGFDSCVMNTFEIMYEFKEIAGVWVGSQGSIPNYTWDYKSIAADLVTEQNPANLTTEFIAN